MESTISALWNGNFKNGKGQFNGAHSAIDSIIYKHDKGEHENTATNPEELMGAAHAACFTMTLSFILEQADIEPESLETEATITIKNNVITNSDLALKAKIPGITDAIFQELAEEAKEMCPVGRAYDVDIGLEATLIS